MLNHLSPFLIVFYRAMGCLTSAERIRFPLLSRSNPGKYVQEVEVDTDSDEAPASTPPARSRTEEEHQRQRAPQKWKWDERPEER